MLYTDKWSHIWFGHKLYDLLFLLMLFDRLFFGSFFLHFAVWVKRKSYSCLANAHIALIKLRRFQHHSYNANKYRHLPRRMRTPEKCFIPSPKRRIYWSIGNIPVSLSNASSRSSVFKCNNNGLESSSKGIFEHYCLREWMSVAVFWLLRVCQLKWGLCQLVECISTLKKIKFVPFDPVLPNAFGCAEFFDCTLFNINGIINHKIRLKSS